MFPFFQKFAYGESDAALKSKFFCPHRISRFSHTTIIDVALIISILVPFFVILRKILTLGYCSSAILSFWCSRYTILLVSARNSGFWLRKKFLEIPTFSIAKVRIQSRDVLPSMLKYSKGHPIPTRPDGGDSQTESSLARFQKNGNHSIRAEEWIRKRKEEFFVAANWGEVFDENFKFLQRGAKESKREIHKLHCKRERDHVSQHS